MTLDEAAAEYVFKRAHRIEGREVKEDCFKAGATWAENQKGEHSESFLRRSIASRNQRIDAPNVEITDWKLRFDKVMEELAEAKKRIKELEDDIENHF